MNILLTGGAGYIGSHVAAALAEAGHNIVVFDSLCNSRPDVETRMGKLLGARVGFVVGDVRDTCLVAESLRSNNIDVVIHFAGLKSVGESIERPLDYFSNNTQGTISLCLAMMDTGVKKMVFSSSATVYGVPQYLPIDELHPCEAINPYGRTKIHIEEMLSDWARSDDDVSIICLRYFNPVGAHASGLIGEDPEGVPNNLMPIVAQVASGKIPHLEVFGNDYPTPDGSGVRDFIHIMDLAEGHLAAVDFVSKQNGWDAINLGTGKGVSVLQLLEQYEVAAGRKIPYRVVQRRKGDVSECYASVDKAERLLRWKAKRGLAEMCSSSWKWQQGIVK